MSICAWVSHSRDRRPLVSTGTVVAYLQDLQDVPRVVVYCVFTSEMITCPQEIQDIPHVGMLHCTL